MNVGRPEHPSTRAHTGQTQQSTKDFAALNVVLSCAVDDFTSKLGRAEAVVAEARGVCPALFASAGEKFEIWHGDEEERFLFEYHGRTVGGGSARYSEDLRWSTDCGRPHVMCAKWLMFRQLKSYERDSPEGESDDDDEQHVHEDFFKILNAFPMAGYRLYEDDHSYDSAVACLPLKLCYGFRTVEPY